MRRGAMTGMAAVVMAFGLAAGIACGSDSSESDEVTPGASATARVTATRAAATPTTEATTVATAEATPQGPATVTTSPTEAPGAAPTTPPQPQPQATPTTAPPPPPPPPPSSQSVSMIAKDTKFIGGGLTLPAGTTINLTLDNQDAGVAHDIVIYAPGGAELARTAIEAGPVVLTTSFTTTGPGVYAYKCSVHPQQMTGGFRVQ